MSEINLSKLSAGDLVKLARRLEQEQVDRLEQTRAELRERRTKEAEATGGAGQRSIPGTSKSWDAESLSAWLDEHPSQARYLQRFQYFGSSDDRNFELFKAVHRSVKRSWGGVELLSCIVGGMFCLNLAVRTRPKRLWLLDRNPLQLLLFELVKRVVLQGGDRHDFMRRLREGDYETRSSWERQLQQGLRTKLQIDDGAIPAQDLRGISRRPLERSWRYALNRFDRLKELLEHTPQQIWFEELQNEAFVDLLLDQPKHWLFLSNVWDLPVRLNDAALEGWVQGCGLEEGDTILSYSRPFRARIWSRIAATGGREFEGRNGPES